MIGKSILSTNDYKFLEKFKNRLLLLAPGGSHAYGTNLPTSDIDIRGIAFNTANEILLTKDFETYTDSGTDTVIYSFNKMIELLTNCNPNTIEILGIPENEYLYLSPEGQQLIDNSAMFLSKKCIDTFGGYATQQLYRLQQKSLVALSEKDYNNHIAKVLNNMVTNFKDRYGIDNIQFYLYDNQIVCDIDKIQNLPITNFEGILSELNNTIRDYNKRSQRNEKAIEHGKIAKHSMHLVRLYLMCLDILNNHEIITKRTDEHDLLMSIRNGEWLGVDGKPTADFFNLVTELEAKLDEAKKSTTLPDKPDYDRINAFRAKMNKMIVERNL